MSNKIAILVTGDRKWSNHYLICEALKKYTLNKIKKVLIHGGCTGADKIAEFEAITLNSSIKIKEYLANWKNYGLYAGPYRNEKMIKKLLKYKERGYECIVLAFHNNIKESKGTKNCINQALKNGFIVRLIGRNIDKLIYNL